MRRDHHPARPPARPRRRRAPALALATLLSAVLLLAAAASLPARQAPPPQPPTPAEAAAPPAGEAAAEPAGAPEAAAEDPAAGGAGTPPPEADDHADADWPRSLFPPPVHQTRIEASYDPETHRIDGFQRLRWHNTSPVPVTELQLHHYLNAFSSNRTTFLRGAIGRVDTSREEGETWGWVEVESIRVVDGGEGVDLKPVEEFLAPEDANPHDRTVARYPLPEPLPPGAWIVLEIDFTSQLPAPPFARTGAWQDYVLASHWYPKIAVFDPDPEDGEAGWDTHQFHPTSEFFADFGDYDVSLTLPERYAGRIGATGNRVEATVAEGRVTERYRQRGVHDFAWTADPRFRVVTARFEPERDVPPELRRRWSRILGVPEEELALAPVDLELFLQPAHAGQGERYLEAARVGLAGLGVRLGVYPWRTLTLVDPPLGAYASMGMEYPTLFTVGTHPLLQVPGFRGLRLPEVVTVHELAHQYFQGMIASNEFEESWLDEGITTFYENRVMADRYGSASLELPGLAIPHLEGLRTGGLDEGRFRDPVVTPTWRFESTSSWGLNSYDRPALVLEHLENLLGEETFHRAMRTFFREHRFTHPDTEDFVATLERVAEQDLGWFLDQALRSTRNLDYAVARLENDRVDEPVGVFWRGGERFEQAADGEEAGSGAEATGDGSPEGGAAAAVRGDPPDGGGAAWRSTVTVLRQGGFLHPVTVEMAFADGRVVRRTWDGRTRWARWTFRGDSRLVRAEVDPDRLMVLDHDRLNNGLLAEPDPAPTAGFVADLLYWFQLLLAATGLLA